MILKTGANAQISIHADSFHHTIVIKEPSFDFFIISSCRDWWIISEMGVKTNRSQQHPEREGPISVIGAIELHIHDRGTKRDWRKYAGRRGGRSHGSSRRGGKRASRTHRWSVTMAPLQVPLAPGWDSNGAPPEASPAQERRYGSRPVAARMLLDSDRAHGPVARGARQAAAQATRQGERCCLKQRRRRRGGARRGLER